MDIQTLSSRLRLGDDGIWYSPDSPAVSYPTADADLYFAVEDDSFWFRHRNRCIVSVVASYPPPDHGVIFDIGGGNGFVAMGIAQAGFDVALVEPGRHAAANAKQRGLETVVCATAESAHFKPQSLPAVGLFDVIEHVADDVAFLRSLAALMKPGGMLYASVPALPLLWSEEDVLAGHFRRYTRAGLSAALRSAGFEIVFASSVFRLLPAPILLLRALPYRIGLAKKKSQESVTRDHVVQNGPLAYVLDAVMASEIGNLDKKRAMRFGASCLIAARRRPWL